MRFRAILLYVCFFLSGASALIYEIVWHRQLTLVFGLSTYSVAAVLAAFFAGLALGARLFSRLADRAARPAHLYAGLELSVAITAAATALAIPLIMHLFVPLVRWSPGWLASNLIRFALALVALCVPCILIGATMPMMARLVARRAGRVAVAFGRFYTVNTLGGLAGAALAGFVLIRFVGVRTTLLFALAGNVAAALLALLVARLPADDAGENRETDRSGAVVSESLHAGPAPDGAMGALPHPRFALTVAVIAGFAALAYEVVWVRLLAVYTLNSVYVFTMVVTVYLAALAIGTGIAARMLRSARFDAARVLVVAQILLALLVPCLLGLIPAANRLEIYKTDASEQVIFLAEYGLTLAVVFVPTVLLGLTLPLLVALFAADVAHAGRTVGRIYALNSLGTILGAALTGTLLVPLVGLRGTLMLLAAINMATAAAAAMLTHRDQPVPRTVLPLGAAAFALLLAVMPTTTQFRRPLADPEDLVLYYAEGPSATVHVTQVNTVQKPYRQLWVDSKSVAGTYPEIVTDQKMLAHLPLLLHENPERALTVGFGTGGTSYSMLQHLVQVHCVEIEPKVPAAYRWFASENHDLVGPNHDRVDFRLIFDDARAWLNVAPEPYDVIVTDVTSIQYRGNGNLYTTDYFRLMQERLAPGGIAGAWVPISGITPEQLKILIASFHAVFPHTSVWYMLNMPTDFVILIGQDHALRIPLATIAVRMQAKLVDRDLAEVGMDNPYKLAACLLLAEDDVDRYVGTPPLHTDDHPVLDYLTHASPYLNTLSVNLRAMVAVRSDPAAYFTSMPAGEAEENPQDTWRRWYAASAYLLEGHAAFSAHGRDRVEQARPDYAQAAQLVPHDTFTQRLVDETNSP